MCLCVGRGRQRTLRWTTRPWARRRLVLLVTQRTRAVDRWWVFFAAPAVAGAPRIATMATVAAIATTLSDPRVAPELIWKKRRAGLELARGSREPVRVGRELARNRPPTIAARVDLDRLDRGRAIRGPLELAKAGTCGAAYMMPRRRYVAIARGRVVNAPLAGVGWPSTAPLCEWSRVALSVALPGRGGPLASACASGGRLQAFCMCAR